MLEVICYTPYLPEGKEQNISFFELLLDENWANGEIVCPEEVYHEVGNINRKLNAKQNYEFLLRAVQKYPLKAIGISKTSCQPSAPLQTSWEDYCADCYIIGKYQQELLSSDYSQSIMQALAENALLLSNSNEALDYLEKMLSHSPEYYAIDDDTQPILLLRGPNICYGTLQFFMDKLAQALRSYRQRVILVNDDENSFVSLSPYVGYRFKAMIGVHSYAFSNLFFSPDATANLSNLIHCPKFNIILDHPIVVRNYADYAGKDYYLLSHDRNYLSFIKQYYHKIRDCFYFPPAGVPFPYSSCMQKKYDITFIGSFSNYRKFFPIIYRFERPLRFLATRLLHIQLHAPNLTMEAALQKALDYYNIQLDEVSFLDLFSKLYDISSCIIYYYREKVIQTLLDANIQVHVYSESWENAPFSEHPCLIRHPKIHMGDSLSVMQQSRISLNLMSWHKDGFTERVLNGMLCGSVVLSDKSTRLEEEFIDGEDIVLFDLAQINALPEKIKQLLSTPEKLQKIAENGYNKALEKHLWAHRAQQLLQLIHHLTDK